MFAFLEKIYLHFRVLISIIFEAMTCRTKPEYKSCNYEEEADGYVSF